MAHNLSEDSLNWSLVHDEGQFKKKKDEIILQLSCLKSSVFDLCILRIAKNHTKVEKKPQT